MGMDAQLADWSARRRRLAQVLMAVGILVCAWQLVRVAQKPRGDFPLHWELGRRLAAGEFIYERGLDVPYLPFWALAHAPLSVVPVTVAQPLMFPMFLAALLVTLATLNRLTARHLPLSKDARTWTAVVSVWVCAGVLHRDTFECGVNLALVALSWLAILAWTHRRDGLAGGLLGLAMALKCTPAAFLAYFVYKRQWKMAASTTLAAIGFTLSPMLWMGPTEYGRAMDCWWLHASRGLTSADPTKGVLGEEKVQNMSLRPALARYLMRVPESHESHIDDPFYAHFLDLPPATAGRWIKTAMLVFALVVAWRFRAPILKRDDPAVLWECAAISVALLLYSPITWGQHCVGVLPAVYLMFRTRLVTCRVSWPVAASLTAFAVVTILLSRDLLGSRWSLLLHSYHVHTGCLLGLLLASLTCHAARTSAAATSRTTPSTLGPRPTLGRAA